MARNEEKAMAMLNRWLRVQSGEEFKKEEKRPYLSSNCDSLAECEKWRRQIIIEISKKVSEIQNPGLGEFKIRDLNDEINKLVREKGHWERRIIELGGPDYLKSSKQVDADGNEVPGSRGYKYYGAARDLPGVRELFSSKDKPVQKRNRSEMYRCADAYYFGFRDEDDAVLLPLEKSAEEDHVASAVLEWTERQAAGGKLANDDDEEEEVPIEEFVAHVPVPSKESIEQALLEQKKKEMIQQYISREEEEAQELAKARASLKRPRED